MNKRVYYYLEALPQNFVDALEVLEVEKCSTQNSFLFILLNIFQHFPTKIHRKIYLNLFCLNANLYDINYAWGLS